MQRSLWVGHRASDSVIVCAPDTAVVTLACFGTPLASDSISASITLEQQIRERLNWTSIEQSYASRQLEVSSGDDFATSVTSIFPYRADPVLEFVGCRWGIPVLAIPSKLFQYLSSKTFLLELGERAESVDTGPGMRIANTAFRTIVQRLGLPFLLKTEDTVSGNGCFWIDSRKDFERTMEQYGDRIRTAWRFLEGTSLNHHFCVTSPDSYVIFPPSIQLIRETGLFRRMEFLGNDFVGPIGLDPRLLSRASEAVASVVQRLALSGFRGVGGADVVANTDGAWVVDINPRLQGSSALLSICLGRCIGRSLGEFHSNSFAREPTSLRSMASTEPLALDFSNLGIQIIVKNGPSVFHGERTLAPGIYRIREGLQFLRPIDFDQRIANDQVVVLDAPPNEVAVAPGAPLARLWLPGGSPVLEEADPIETGGALISGFLRHKTGS